ncbi:MAG: SoxR reducing system RseC family protein [Christensenellales bacterium]
MVETGTVIKTEGKLAIVRFKRHAACGSCKACGMSSDDDSVEITAHNAAGATAGDYVRVALKSSSVMGASALAYILPLVFLFAGVGLGYATGPVAALGGVEETAAVFGLGLCILSFAGLKLMDGMFRRSGKFAPRIMSIVDEHEITKEE